MMKRWVGECGGCDCSNGVKTSVPFSGVGLHVMMMCVGCFTLCVRVGRIYARREEKCVRMCKQCQFLHITVLW